MKCNNVAALSGKIKGHTYANWCMIWMTLCLLFKPDAAKWSCIMFLGIIMLLKDIDVFFTTYFGKHIISIHFMLISYIYIAPWRILRGFKPPKSLPYRPFWGWFGPAIWPLSPPPHPPGLYSFCRIRYVALTLYFLWHFTGTIRHCSDTSVGNPTCQHFYLCFAI